MNDPITLAATDHEGRDGTPDTTPAAPDAPGTQPIRTLLETAATCRPLEEVTALVSLLKEGGGAPDAGHDALRTAAVNRPVHDVRRMVTLLGQPPHELVEADITLRAAAVGRSIEDVALLVSILGDDAPVRRPDPVPAEPEKAVVLLDEPDEEPYELPYTELYDAPYRQPPGLRGAPAAEPSEGSPVLRHVLRWPVAIALLVSGALHLPADLAALPSAAPGGFLPLLVTVVCLGLGVLLAVRDTTTVWRAGAVAAVGVVALHVVGGAAGFDPLAGAVGSTLAWAGVTAVLCAAGGAVLAGLALRNRPQNPV